MLAQLLRRYDEWRTRKNARFRERLDDDLEDIYTQIILTRTLLTQEVQHGEIKENGDLVFGDGEIIPFDEIIRHVTGRRR